jgi:hypothetical protein
MGMNNTQTDHLNRILDQSRHLITEKYIKGAKEHDSTLSEDYSVERLLEEAINEAIDQITYLLTLKEKLNGTSRNL